MNQLPDNFYKELFLQQQQKEAVPTNTEINGRAEWFICVLYPQLSTSVLCSKEAVRNYLDELQSGLTDILNATTACQAVATEEIAQRFFNQVPAHLKTGIYIHPAAQIGEYFCIDYGTGIVIGETTTIGYHVKLYRGIALNASCVKKELAFTKRHPTVEDPVVDYSGATILGGGTVTGHHSFIGGNGWVTTMIPAGSLVYHQPEI